MMLKIANGKCVINTIGNAGLERVQGVYYRGKAVYVNLFQGLAIGKYRGASTLDENNDARRFGEIKFTTGVIKNGVFYGNYVLCEY